MNVDPQKIQAMIGILQSMLESENTPPTKNVQPIAVTETLPSQPSFSTNKKAYSSSKVNKFDTMMEKNMHKEDTLIDQKLNVHPPVARSRSYQPITLRCRVCGKQETINPQLAISTEAERYKCNKCSSSPG